MLEAPQEYKFAAPEEKAKICNGAGPSVIKLSRGKTAIGRLVNRIATWCWEAVPDTIYGLSITEPANIHDWMYVKLPKTLLSKQHADFTFLLNMFRVIHTQTTRVPVLGCLLRHVRYLRAVKYFEAVSEYGHQAFFNEGGINGDSQEEKEDETRSEES